MRQNLPEYSSWRSVCITQTRISVRYMQLNYRQFAISSILLIRSLRRWSRGPRRWYSAARRRQRRSRKCVYFKLSLCHQHMSSLMTTFPSSNSNFNPPTQNLSTLGSFGFCLIFDRVFSGARLRTYISPRGVFASFTLRCPSMWSEWSNSKNTILI